MKSILDIRAQFPALKQVVNHRSAVYLDGPGGTQVPQSVIEAMSEALTLGISNHGGPFLTSARTDGIVDDARLAMVDFLNAQRPEEIVFGQNMTSLTFAMSRALTRSWESGDEIILTRLDHDANISPWLLAAEDRGLTVRWLDFDPADCRHKLESLDDLINNKTKLVAVTYASNAVGSISEIKKIAKMAHAAGALVYVDAVHYAPHGPIDVQELGCDFLVSSAYKYFGPHTGILYGRYELLDHIQAYKVRPAPAKPAGKWETGTQSFESLAGVTAAVNYIAGLSDARGTRRLKIKRAMTLIKEYEKGLSERFLRGAAQVPGLRVYGVTDIESLDQRTPTFAVNLQGFSPQKVATRLGEQGIFVWHGNYYAVEVMERLGFPEQGLVRIGFVHYNTVEEVQRVLDALKEMTQS